MAMITYDLDKRGRQSKYEYLYRCIRKDIREGALPAGARLPSKRTLSDHLSVSVSTVEQAYDMLVSEGYVKPKPGSGFFVCAGRDKGTYPEDGARGQGVPSEAVAPASMGNDLEDGDVAADAEEDEGVRFDVKANRCSLKLFPVDTWSRIMRKTLSDRNPVLFETVPFNGVEVLRRAIATHLYEFKGVQTTPDRIIVGAGTEYLYGRLLQLFGPNCVIAIGEVGTSKMVNVSRSIGTLWNYLPMDEEGMRVDLLDAGHADVVHVSPANSFPTGAVMPLSRRAKLLEWVHEKPDRYIIEDDYDSELRFTGRALPPLFTQDDRDKVIYMNTFSKTLVPSLRISYMVLPEALMDLYRRQLSFYSCTVSSFEQCALAEFITRGYFERHINRLRRYYGHQRANMIAALKASPLMAIATVHAVDVGTHLILQVNTKRSDQEIRQAALDRGMHLAMLADYCLRPTIYDVHRIVINFASIEPEQIPEVVDLLTDVFRDEIRRANDAEGR